MAAQKLKVLIVGLSSCVAITPRRETHGDESAMNLRGIPAVKPTQRTSQRWSSPKFTAVLLEI